MLKVLNEQELHGLSNVILATSLSTSLNDNQKPIILAIRKLKRYTNDDGDAITTWIYDTLKARKTTINQMSDPINQVLVELLEYCIAFHNEINNTGPFDTLFNLVKKEALTMSWLACLMGEKLPQLVTHRIHEILILGFASYGNPYLGTSNDNHKNLIYISGQLFEHLLKNNDATKEIIISSVVTLFDEYVHLTKSNAPLTTDIQKFTLSYILSLPKISAILIEESWSILFNRLYENDTAGSIFLYEKETRSSLVRTSVNDVQDLASVFTRWLSVIAFEPKGVIMKHAMDVAIMIDTLAYDPRLNLKHMIPAGNKSIIDSLRPSFDALDVKITSIDLIQWTISLLSPTSSKSQRDVDDLKIPLFLLQLVVLKDDKSKETAADVFVQLITQLDQPSNLKSSNVTKYLVLNLISSAESKWPGILQLVLENIFSRAIAMHIVNSEGSVNVEKILGNLAMIFEKTNDASDEQQHQPGFEAFQKYITSHWRQVLLLFVNHPSVECRAMGYRVLTNSRFWENNTGIEGCDPHTVAKILLEAWFRHMKGRYLRIGLEDEALAIKEHQKLIIGCCQNMELAKAILSFTIDGVLGGALEIFPAIDANTVQQEKLSLFEKVQQDINERNQMPNNYSSKKPPQFVTTLEYSDIEEVDARDKIYIDNIQRTAALFLYFKDSPSILPEQYKTVVSFILTRLVSIWQPSPVPLSKYDDVLPKNIPYQCDIVIGSAFKDHPVLFLIFEEYISIIDKTQYPINDIIRSILIYFIVFWYMKEVVNVPTTLRFSTQLEETSRLMLLLSSLLPDFLANSYYIFPFLSAKDLGDILFQVVWYFLRWHPSLNNNANIPGIKVTNAIDDNQEELVNKCKKNLLTIINNRLETLKGAPTWYNALSDCVAQLNI